MKNISISLLSLLVLILSACNSTTTVSSDPYAGAWFDAYGNACGYTPRAGCDYNTFGAKVWIYQDPYYSLWDKSGYFWTSPSGITYNQSGYAINSVSDDLSSDSADVITSAAVLNQQVMKEASKKLTDEYALSEATALTISQSLQTWAQLGKARARTQADITDMSKRLYGIDADKIAASLTKAQSDFSLKPLEGLNIEIAAYWGTTPETSKTILQTWYKAELSQFSR